MNQQQQQQQQVVEHDSVMKGCSFSSAIIGDGENYHLPQSPSQHHRHHHHQQQPSWLNEKTNSNADNVGTSASCPFPHDILLSEKICPAAANGTSSSSGSRYHHLSTLSSSSTSSSSSLLSSSSSPSLNMDEDYDDGTTAFATAQLESLLIKQKQLATEIQQSTQKLEQINANRSVCAYDFEYKDALRKKKKTKQSSTTSTNCSSNVANNSKCPMSSLRPNSPESGDELLSSSNCDNQSNRSHILLRSIYNAQLSAALHLENPSKLFLDLLNEVISLVRCQYSFIGELKHSDDGKPYLHSHAISFARMKLTQEALDLFHHCSCTEFKFSNMDTLFGHTLVTGEPVLTNDPKNHPKASKTHIPPGHPPLNSFLGLPFIYNNKLVGMIGLANKEGGFHKDDIEFLEPICTTCATIIVAWQFYLEREEAKEKLKLANLNLEQRIEQRTEELLRSNIKLREEVEHRRIVEQELLEQRKISEKVIMEKEQFLRNVSHDCRTPLSCILGLSDLLLGSSQHLSNDQYEYLTMIRNSGETMLCLINDFLDLMKLEQHMKLNSEYFYPNEPFEEVIDLIVLECTKKNIELVMDYKTGFPFNIVLNSDKGRFKQVLLNLLSNAVKFTDSGFIYVGAQIVKNNEQAQIEIEVRDTGIGIEKENLPKIGQPFLQFNASQNPQQKGTGLGVSISKMIANALGGNLKVESEGINKGSKFLFTCKVPFKEIEDLTLEDQSNLEKKSAKHVGLFSLWKNHQAHHSPSSSENNQVILVHDKNPLFSHSLKNFVHNFNSALGISNHHLENFTICTSKQTLIESISTHLKNLDQLDKLIIVVDVKQLEQKDHTIQTLCHELNLPPDQVEIIAGEYGKKIRLLPSMVFSSTTTTTNMMGLKENVGQCLTKPIFKLNDFTLALKPSVFLQMKPFNDKRVIVAEEELLKIAGHFNVLVIDDNVINSKVLSHILIKLGLQRISIASSGEEAIKLVKNTYFNIIFLDLFMDGMDGFETSRIIQQTCKENAPNIVLLTANIVNEKEEEELIRNGVKYFMFKPTRFTEIRQRVLDIVRKQ